MKSVEEFAARENFSTSDHVKQLVKRVNAARYSVLRDGLNRLVVIWQLAGKWNVIRIEDPGHPQEWIFHEDMSFMEWLNIVGDGPSAPAISYQFYVEAIKFAGWTERIR